MTIRVTIELVPFGIGKPRHLGTALIANDGSGDVDVGNYVATLSKWGRPNAVWKTAEVKGFRRRKRGAWDLLYLVLKEAVGKRNDKK